MKLILRLRWQSRQSEATRPEHRWRRQFTSNPLRSRPAVQRATNLFGIEVPILQAPMAGASGSSMAIEVAKAGGLASLPCAMLSHEQIRQEVQLIRSQTTAPLNLNFFCHTPPTEDVKRAAAWKEVLRPYYNELGADFDTPTPVPSRAPFDSATCGLVELLKPEVVSFHFGLPPPDLLSRVKATGAKIISSATTVEEASWLELRGCDAIIAMGYEAGGHRGNFLTDKLYTQVGTLALVPQIIDAVKVPVIAAGGIADGRGVAAALLLGAAAVQVGTAYLFCPEAKVHPQHKIAICNAIGSDTALTNVFSGRPARGIMNRIMRELGPMSDMAPAFPLAGGALVPLRSKAESIGNASGFINMWAGQGVGINKHNLTAAQLTRQLAEDAMRIIAP